MKAFVIFLVLGSSVAAQFVSEDDLQRLFYRAGMNELSENDLKALKEVFEIYNPRSAFQRQNKSSRGSMNCLLCRGVFAALFDLVHGGQSDDMLNSAVVNLCTVLSIASPATCKGIVPLNVPILTYIIRTTPEAEPRTFCSLVLQNAVDPNICVNQDPRFEWAVDLPERVNVQPQKNEKPLTVALITDAHIDPYYEPNGVADCNEPTCCRPGQSPRTNNINYMDFTNVFFGDSLDEESEDKNITNSIQECQPISDGAGFWGDYRNCDTPIWAYDDVIERVASEHKNIDVVYYMGDSIDHHVWETTYEMINEINLYVIDKMRKEFGDNIVILPSIGNHESQPTNQFAPSSIKGEKLNTTWLYKSLAYKWGYYLTEEAKATVREHGGFSMLIRPGLRVISINSNIAYKFNWWLVYDPLDSKRHLDWLVQELYKAELAGESVHILSHIPPGVHDLIYAWTREYNRIVNRFSSTIKAEFNGHTHADEFKIFYSLEDGSAINMAWGAGGATAYSFYNLNYKIATFNDNFEPSNIINYVYNLTEANLTPERRPHWFQLYNMRTNYRITDLSAATMDDLVHKMVTDDLFLLDLYAAYYSKLSDGRWWNCNSQCKIDNLCKAVVTVLWHREKCEELRRLYF